MNFELVAPESCAEAISLLEPDDPAVRAITAGMALILKSLRR
jgi:hypothetical protein